MEIMECIAKGLKANRLTFYVYYIVPILLLILVYIIGIPELSEGNNATGNGDVLAYSFFYYITPWIIITIIYIWLYYAPKYCRNVNDLQKAFEENKEYEKLYIKYKEWIRQNDLSGNIKSCLAKITFFLLWFLGTALFDYCLFKMEILSKSLKVLPLYFLHSITSVLNFSSYYLCISFIFFMKKVSQLDLEHNTILPSATYGFKILKNSVNTIYIFFLLDSMFCTIAYVTMCIFCIKNVKLDNFNAEFIYMTSYVGALGLGSCLGIACFINYYFKQIYNKWKDDSLHKLHKELLEAEKENKSTIEKDLLDRIDILQRDRISISGQAIIISIIANLTQAIAALIPILL